MIDLKENHVLSKDEIRELRDQGYSLDDNKMHIIRFGFNDKWNNAADPRPFRIKTKAIEPLAKDAIEMPYVVKPYDNKLHIRGSTEGKPDTALGLLSIQAKYAIGTIKAPIITPSKNVYFVIEVWKEFEKAVEEGRIPQFTSPTILPIKEDADGIEEAQFLNLNGVESPGYPEVLAGTIGVCKGGIKKCMEELAPLAAAGQLNATRLDGKSFSILQNKIHSSMSMQEGKSEPSLGAVAKDVENLKSDVTAIRSDMGAIKTTVDAIAQKFGGDTPKDKPPVGAAGNDPKPGQITIPPELKENEFVKTLLEKTETQGKLLKTIEEERAAEKKKAAELARAAQAESIVNKQILLKQVKKEDKDKKIKEYLELKKEDGTLEDLTALDNFLKSTVSEPPADGEAPVGASGYEPPELQGDRDFTSDITNTDALDILGGSDTQ